MLANKLKQTAYAVVISCSLLYMGNTAANAICNELSVPDWVAFIVTKEIHDSLPKKQQKDWKVELRNPYRIVVNKDFDYKTGTEKRRILRSMRLYKCNIKNEKVRKVLLKLAIEKRLVREQIENLTYKVDLSSFSKFAARDDLLFSKSRIQERSSYFSGSVLGGFVNPIDVVIEGSGKKVSVRYDNCSRWHMLTERERFSYSMSGRELTRSGTNINRKTMSRVKSMFWKQVGRDKRKFLHFAWVPESQKFEIDVDIPNYSLFKGDTSETPKSISKSYKKPLARFLKVAPKRFTYIVLAEDGTFLEEIKARKGN